MDAELKRQWSAALRSGKFEQVTGRLTDRCNGRCCLGVLAEVANLKLNPDPNRDGVLNADGNHSGYDPLDDLLCSDYRIRDRFVGLNDRKGLSFAEIADEIDGGAVFDTNILFDAEKAEDYP